MWFRANIGSSESSGTQSTSDLWSALLSVRPLLSSASFGPRCLLVLLLFSIQEEENKCKGKMVCFQAVLAPFRGTSQEHLSPYPNSFCLHHTRNLKKWESQAWSGRSCPCIPSIKWNTQNSDFHHCFVILGKLFDFTEPHFSQLQSENDISIYFSVLLLGLNTLMCVTHLARCTEWRSTE